MKSVSDDAPSNVISMAKYRRRRTPPPSSSEIKNIEEEKKKAYEDEVLSKYKVATDEKKLELYVKQRDILSGIIKDLTNQIAIVHLAFKAFLDIIEVRENNDEEE